MLRFRFSFRDTHTENNQREKGRKALNAGRWLLAALLLLACAWSLRPASAEKQKAPEQISQTALQQIAALVQEKESRTPAQQKIDSHLLLAIRVKRGEAIARAVPSAAQNTALADAEGNVVVDIKADVSSDLQTKIEQLGGEVIGAFPQYHSLRARLPLISLEALAGEAAVKFIRPAEEPMTNRAEPGRRANPQALREQSAARAARLSVFRNQLAAKLAALKISATEPHRASALTGPVDSEGDVAHRADQVRALGINGTGIRIAVMSDGVDSLATEQAAGELPATVTVVPGQAGSGDEGTAMLEIVYDLARGPRFSLRRREAGLRIWRPTSRRLRARLTTATSSLMM